MIFIIETNQEIYPYRIRIVLRILFLPLIIVTAANKRKEAEITNNGFCAWYVISYYFMSSKSICV